MSLTPSPDHFTISFDSDAAPDLRGTRSATQSVWIKFDKVGFHRYPDAPEVVSYLREVHRHVFKFKVAITVHHDDREIEFHMMKNWITGLYEQSQHHSLQLDHKSCEMLAQELINRVLTKYDCSQRTVVVEVSEDGECGAVVTSAPAPYAPEGSYKGQQFVVAPSFHPQAIVIPATGMDHGPD
jgi:hypothetical protein